MHVPRPYRALHPMQSLDISHIVMQCQPHIHLRSASPTYDSHMHQLCLFFILSCTWDVQLFLSFILTSLASTLASFIAQEALQHTDYTNFCTFSKQACSCKSDAFRTSRIADRPSTPVTGSTPTWDPAGPHAHAVSFVTPRLYEHTVLSSNASLSACATHCMPTALHALTLRYASERSVSF